MDIITIVGVLIAVAVGSYLANMTGVLLLCRDTKKRLEESKKLAGSG